MRSPNRRRHRRPDLRQMNCWVDEAVAHRWPKERSVAAGCVDIIADRFERHARFQIAGNWAARFRVNAVVQDTRCGAGPSTPTMQIQLPSIRRLPKRELFVTPSPAMSARRVRSEQLSGRDGAEQRASGPECRCHID